MRRKAYLALFLVLAASQAQAAVVAGVDFRDAFGGLMGLAAVLFYVQVLPRGQKSPGPRFHHKQA